MTVMPSLQSQGRLSLLHCASPQSRSPCLALSCTACGEESFTSLLGLHWSGVGRVEAVRSRELSSGGVSHRLWKALGFGRNETLLVLPRFRMPLSGVNLGCIDQVGEVWRQYTAGDCGVVVCHIDSGTHWTSNNWYNAGEYGGIPLVDDDGNGESSISRDQEGIVPVSCF